ncbi:MAG: metallophosphoesterase [Granulosicoccus sp.]
MTALLRQLKFLNTLLLTGLLCTNTHAAVKVAFVADQGVSSNAQSVLSLIKNEGTDLLLIQGDLGYADNTATSWEANLSNIMGEDFPVLTVVGNHENYEWPLYKRYIDERLDRVADLQCTGDPGVKASCRFGNIQVVQIAPEIHEVPGVKPYDDYADFIRNSFRNSDATWRVCAWHKNEATMQVATKDSRVGWDIHNACLENGAMVVTGHAHTYSRTYLLDDYATQSVAHRHSDMTLEPGTSFTVVSGLGGHDIRPQSRSDDWFASIYTATQGANHGALFCTFDNDAADCYFKSIDGSQPDRFTLNSAFAGSFTPAETDPSLPSDTPTGPGVFSRTDKEEFRWIALNSSGRWGSRRIDESCAERLGGPAWWGDWGELISIAPATDSVNTPCDFLADGGNPSPPPPTAPNSPEGFVYSRTDKTEFRWIAQNERGEMGSIWINEACVEAFGPPSAFGDWHDLMALAPGFDTVRSPCSTGTPRSAIDNAGFVFSRTDKREFRWIENRESGEPGNVWIDETCAKALGGATASGDWYNLIDLAPAVDTIANPCY